MLGVSGFMGSASGFKVYEGLELEVRLRAKAKRQPKSQQD